MTRAWLHTSAPTRRERLSADFIYIYMYIYWHYAACSNRTGGSLFNPTRAVYLCAHECLRYAMKGLSRRTVIIARQICRQTVTPLCVNASLPFVCCRLWAGTTILYSFRIFSIFFIRVFSSPRIHRLIRKLYELRDEYIIHVIDHDALRKLILHLQISEKILICSNQL